jgi:hypothetical protein
LETRCQEFAIEIEEHDDISTMNLVKSRTRADEDVMRSFVDQDVARFDLGNRAIRCLFQFLAQSADSRTKSRDCGRRTNSTDRRSRQVTDGTFELAVFHLDKGATASFTPHQDTARAAAE